MKTQAAVAILAPALLVMGQDANVEPRGGFGHGGGGRGWGPRGHGGPFGDGGSGCARDCVSSFWETADPSPTAFCDGKGGLHSCISSACSHEGDQWTAYSSRSASLCHEYLSCGSTGTYTYTYQTPSGDWWGGGWRGDKDKSFPTGEVVVTGCPWHGDGWGFPYWGGLGYGNKFWDDMGPGWERATVTTTVHGGGTPQVMVLEEAHSGDVSTIRTVGLEAVETGSSDSDGGDSGAPAVGGQSVLAMGAALGAVIALIGLM